MRHTSPGSFTPAVQPPEQIAGPTHCFAFSGERILVSLDAGKADLPSLSTVEELGLLTSRHYLGRWNERSQTEPAQSLSGERHCFAVDLSEDAQPPTGMALKGLRQLFGVFDEPSFAIAGRAFQILNWDRTHRFCGRCGSATQHHTVDRARECPECGLLSFPRVSPAIIVLVHKGSEFLLAHNGRFPSGRYSILAGFVEPGETLEQAVVREIREEVGIEVKDIRYFGSQSWPFPHSLMVGFTCQHASGDIEIDGEEIVDAGWYTKDHLPDLPDGISISRQIIDWFLEQQ